MTASPTAQTPSAPPGVTLDVPIEGMTCAACATRLARVLRKQDVVADAEVSFATERATLQLAADAVVDAHTADKLVRTVQKAGFNVPTQHVVLDVKGMTCTACATRVRDAVQLLPGVEAAAVSVTNDTAQVSYIPGLVDTADLTAAVARTGYEASVAPTSEEQAAARRRQAERERRREAVLLAVVWVCTLPMLAPMVAMPFGVHWMPPAPLQLALATVVQVLAGARFYKGAYHALRAKSGNMDVLVALGTTSAFVLSIVHMVQGVHDLYFEASASVLAFVLVGKHLERRAKQQTHSAQDALQALRPETCRLLDDDGGVREVSPDAVSVGQRVEVMPQTPIPVDGVVLEGTSRLNAAHLTGESDLLRVGVGDDVAAGALNQDGVLIVECTRIGAEGTLARMIRLIEQAQTERAPIERQVDKVSAVFVPVVTVLAALVLGVHLLLGFDTATAVLRAVAVLVVACPCALGLATPTALVVGVGVAAKWGVLFRGAAALERLSRVDVVAFDKTGTLTHGTPKLAAGMVLGTDDNVVVDEGDDLARRERARDPEAPETRDPPQPRDIGVAPQQGASVGREGTQPGPSTPDDRGEAGEPTPELGQRQSSGLRLEGSPTVAIAGGIDRLVAPRDEPASPFGPRVDPFVVDPAPWVIGARARVGRREQQASAQRHEGPIDPCRAAQGLRPRAGGDHDVTSCDEATAHPHTTHPAVVSDDHPLHRASAHLHALRPSLGEQHLKQRPRVDHPLLRQPPAPQHGTAGERR